MKRKNSGFTLAELLIVVAIIAVLVAISIPIFTNQLEKSRESTDLANVRAAYAKVMVQANLEETDGLTETVKLKQKTDDWQGFDKKTLTIGGIKATDTAHWHGQPVAEGECEITYDYDSGIHFYWNGGTGSYYFDVNENDLHVPLISSGVLNDRSFMSDNQYFEIDSKCPSSKMVPKVKQMIKNNSLLSKGTWAYYGRNGSSGDSKNKRYLFWTSLDTDKVGEGKKIPVIIQNAGTGRFYIAESETCKYLKDGKPYVRISDHIEKNETAKNLISNINSSKEYYTTLQEAYDAYNKLLNTNYSQLKEYEEK